jgi:hypothetical protein
MKAPKDILDVVRKLPQEKREKVEAVVRRHLKACRKFGIIPEAMDRVWLEAMEAVEVEVKFPELANESDWDWEPFRKYDVYTTPLDVRR